MCQPNVISIILADDHLLFRSTVLDVLSAEKEMQILADVSDGAQALRAIQEFQPRVAVLDIEMPVRTGFEVARTVREKGIATAVILLTLHREAHIVRSAVELGVSGYILKDDLDTSLVLAIRLVAEGGTFFSPRLVMPQR